MIVTRMCANLIIRKIYKDGSPSVKVALSQHYNGSERPCKRFLRVRIYTALCELIDELLKDIQHLELECISTRYLLSQYMDEDHGGLLRSDILENLGCRHYDIPAYQLFTELQYDGGDPMEFRDYLVKVRKACKGEWPCWH